MTAVSKTVGPVTMAVALALFAAAYVVLWRLRLVGEWLPSWFFCVGTLVLIRWSAAARCVVKSSESSCSP